MKYFVPRRRNTLNIDFNDNSRNSSAAVRQFMEDEQQQRASDSGQEQASANLKFLKDAQMNIHELVARLTSKMDEIDSTTEMAGADGLYGDDAAAAVEMRVLKKAQLRVLKDNVTVLSHNLEALMTRNMETAGRIYIDIGAIEAVISETANMIVMLDSEDVMGGGNYEGRPTETEGNQNANFNSDLDDVDRMVAELEQEAYAMGDMINMVETLNFSEDSLMEELEATFDSINLPAEISITPANFDPKDTNRRPANWKDIRLKRILIKEYVDRLEGVPEAAIRENRQKNIEMVSHYQ
jgi:hypothetical protein